jgi:ABC-type dipeptide transport system, periplasmic component
MDAVLFGLAKPMFGAPADVADRGRLAAAAQVQHRHRQGQGAARRGRLSQRLRDHALVRSRFAGVNEPLCVLTQESLAQIGIKCTINKIPGATWRTELNKKVLPLYTNVFSGWLDYPEYFFIWCYHGKNSIFNTMSYQSKELDALIDGAVTAAAEGDKSAYDKDVKGFVDLAFADIPRIRSISLT